MRRTKADAAVTREQVLDAALRIFSQKGYSATTLEDVAVEAGVTRGAVYWHFKGKPELYRALISERMAKMGAIYADALSSQGSALEVLARLLSRSFEHLMEDPEYRAVVTLNWFKTELTPELEAGFRQKIARLSEFIDTVAGLIRKGIAAGEIDRTIDPKAAALSAVALLNGVTTMYLMDPTLIGSKMTMRRVVQTYIRGLRA
jgi:TetR/AcrR family transcriptional regulator, acrAB operon repressor